MGNVRIMAESFVCAGFFLTSVMDYGGWNRKHGNCACCRLLFSELRQELESDNKCEEELKKKLPPKDENTPLIKLI